MSKILTKLNLVNDIFELCSLKMNDRFNSFSQLKECSLKEKFNDRCLELADYRSEVLLYGANITIRFQFFYNRKSFGPLLAHIYEQSTNERIVDFFNEVGNLTGGKVKEVLFEQNIITALSLPMCIDTNKDKILTTSEVLSENRFFEVSFKDQSIYAAKISFEIHDQDKFLNFDKNFSKSDIQDGEVDFF